MPAEHPSTWRYADRLRTDVANVETGLEVIIEQPRQAERAESPGFLTCSQAKLLPGGGRYVDDMVLPFAVSASFARVCGCVR